MAGVSGQRADSGNSERAHVSTEKPSGAEFAAYGRRAPACSADQRIGNARGRSVHGSLDRAVSAKVDLFGNFLC